MTAVVYLTFPDVPHTTLGDNEGGSFFTSQALTAATHKVAFHFIASKAGTIDSIGFLLGTVTTGDTLKISIQGVDTTTGNPDGSILGNSKTIVVADTDDNKWVETATGMAVTITQGQVFCIVVEFNTWVAGNLNVDAGSGDTRAAFTHSILVNRYGGASWAKSTAAVPNVSIKLTDGTLLVAPGNYPHIFRVDPFFFKTPTGTAGPNTLATTGTALTSTAHGLTVTRPFQRVRLTSGAQAGEVRTCIAVPTVDTCTLDQAFSVDQSAGTTWDKYLFPSEDALKFVAPFSGRLMGMWATIFINNSGNLDAQLYDSDGFTVLASLLNYDEDYALGNTGTVIFLPFTTNPYLQAGKTYYLALGINSGGANSVGLVCATMPDAATHGAWPGGANLFLTERIEVGITPTLSSTGTAVTLSAALTGVNQVVLGDYVRLTSGAQSGEFRSITGITDQQHVTIATAFSANQSAVTWNRVGAWSDRSLIRPMIGLVFDTLISPPRGRIVGGN